MKHYILFKCFINDLFNETKIALMSTTNLDEIEHIYNYFKEESKVFKNGVVNKTLSIDEREELLNLIKSNSREIRNMIYGGGKDNGKN